jgi:hypothetical protein
MQARMGFDADRARFGDGLGRDQERLLTGPLCGPERESCTRCLVRIAVQAARSAARDTGNQPRAPREDIKERSPWLVYRP